MNPNELVSGDGSSSSALLDSSVGPIAQPLTPSSLLFPHQHQHQDSTTRDTDTITQEPHRITEQDPLLVSTLVDEDADHSQETLDTPPAEPSNLNLKDIQNAINAQHLFGIKIWKPALYKKNRSIDVATYNALHASPILGQNFVTLGNVCWVVMFGWWIGLVYVGCALLLLPFAILGKFCSLLFPAWSQFVECWDYAQVLFNLAGYMVWPFGKFIAKRIDPDALASPRMNNNEPSLSSGWPNQDGVSERSFLLGKNEPVSTLSRMTLSKCIFRILVILVLAPVHLIVTGLCFFFVFSVPVARMSFVMLKYVYNHPLQLSAHVSSDLTESVHARQLLKAHERALEYLNRKNQVHPKAPAETAASPHWIMATPGSLRPYSFVWNEEEMNAALGSPPNPDEITVSIDQPAPDSPEFVIILCIRYALGLQYYKYTLDGINIVFMNFLAIVIFTLVDFYLVGPHFGYTGIASHNVIFVSGLVSVIPLAYFIGMAVSSITAQTGSLALGAVINATFGSIIEVILYCLALMEGKERMVEGSIIGSFLCGLLALPGAAMLSGGIRRKEQRFNAKSAGITSTLMIMALIGAFTPTLFQQTYGHYELKCLDCPTLTKHDVVDTSLKHLFCRSCRYTQPHPTQDPFYANNTKPLMYFCAIVLVLTYAVGLLFTLRTHSSRIYPKLEEIKKSHPSSPLSKGKESVYTSALRPSSAKKRSVSSKHEASPHYGSISEPTSSSTRPHSMYSASSSRLASPPIHESGKHKVRFQQESASPDWQDSPCSSPDDKKDGAHEQDVSSHGNPNWGALKSTLVLLLSTIAFSLIAEVLVDSVDGLLQSNKYLDEKFIGLTLFALVPSVTEFYNAIAFATQGNIVLALEIGSAYTIQVALLQIPALVAFSAWTSSNSGKIGHTSSSASPLPGMKIMSALDQLVSETPPSHSTAPLPFTLIFPRWDVYTVIFSTLILTYIYIEGKSNYFKGSMLLLAYAVMTCSFWFVPFGLSDS